MSPHVAAAVTGDVTAVTSALNIQDILDVFALTPAPRMGSSF
jgi:hypothetical protein